MRGYLIGSVIIASASSVSKTFLIGSVGYYAVKRPKSSPYLPSGSVSTVSRFSFTVLVLPLIFSGIASSVTLSSLASLWIIVFSAVVVIAASYIIATLLYHIPYFKKDIERMDFEALRISAAFPNIVSLPVLTFPALCEYEVVYDSFRAELWPEASSPAESITQCTSHMNAMVFTYFFAWSFLFWSLGHAALIKTGENKQRRSTREKAGKGPGGSIGSITEHESFKQGEDGFVTMQIHAPSSPIENHNQEMKRHARFCESHHSNDETEPTVSQINDTKSAQSTNFKRYCPKFLQNVLSSPGFLAMALAFVTVCIPPFQSALFRPGGALRFLGAALESLGQAGSTFANIIVAASLAVGSQENEDEDGSNSNAGAINDSASEDGEGRQRDDLEMEIHHHNKTDDTKDHISKPKITSITTTPQQSPPTTTTRSYLSNLQNQTIQTFQSLHRSLTSIDQANFKLSLWYFLSRLILAPAVVCAILLILDNFVPSSSAFHIPDLTKLVVLANSCMPGALIVVVVLESNGLSDTASTVGKVYIPNYLISIVTIAAWTSVALLISIPSSS